MLDVDRFCRLKTSLQEPFLKRQEFKDLENDAEIISKVYPVVRINNFLNKEFLSLLREELQENVTYTKRNTDLYHFYQSGDLKGNSSKLIQQLCESLLSEELCTMIETIIGKPLQRGFIDVSSQRYSQGDYLLAHDDRLDTRRVAFVLYLTEQNDSSGGELDFVPTDWRGAPINIEKQRIIPKENSLVFFQVSKSSHHQVSEVLSKDFQRISISGWFHDPPKPTSIPKSISSPFFIKNDNRITEEFLMELSTYASFRQSDAKRYYTRNESFRFYQEFEEPLWMKSLMREQFDKWLTFIHDEKLLDWPTRPILKYYEEGDFRRKKSAVAHEEEPVVKVFIIIRTTNYDSLQAGSLLIINDDLIIPCLHSNQSITLVEMEFNSIDLNKAC